MLIGINAVAAFKRPRTGVEEYVYRLIQSLARLEQSQKFKFILYNRGDDSLWDLPPNFRLKGLRWALPAWTQMRLTAELAVKKPDVLLIPAHILPVMHPHRSIVVVHGLEYEYYPETYAWSRFQYLHLGTKYAVKHAHHVIASSKSTKRDLVELYKVRPDKISVVHLGFTPLMAEQKKIFNYPYFLYLGRIETKKNIVGIIKAFSLFKERHDTNHKLILAGSLGHGGDLIRSEVMRCRFKDDIVAPGYINEEQKASFLAWADIFLFPSFCEGFGIPILEAQSVGCPVITSNVSSMPEVAGNAALVSPGNVDEIARMMYKIIRDKDFRKELVEGGFRNIERFSWDKCARDTLEVLVK